MLLSQFCSQLTETLTPRKKLNFWFKAALLLRETRRRFWQAASLFMAKFKLLMVIKKTRLIARKILTSSLNFLMLSKVFRLALFGVIRATKVLPDNGLKDRVYNWTESLRWGVFDFAAVPVNIGSVAVQLTPHCHEFDFAAILYKKLNYETEIYSFLDSLEAYDGVFDIGANIGVFSLYMAHRMPEAKVYAFEPGREAFSRLLANIKANSSTENIINPFFSAVGPESALVQFYTPDDHLTNSSIDAKFAQKFGAIRTVIAQVAPKSLFEELFKRHKSILVKIDVEGAESAVLENLREMITLAEADLLIEILPDFADELRSHFNYFLAAGYCAYSLQSSGAVPMTELAASNRWRDWWFSKRPIRSGR